MVARGDVNGSSEAVGGLVKGRLDNIRIPRRPWDESLLNMNARLMRGPSLGNKRNMRKITAWGPENQKSIESCKSLEFVSDLQVTGIP